MPNKTDVRARVADRPGATVVFGPVEGVMQDASGNRLRFIITVAQAGPKVPQPPPKLKIELAGPEPGGTTSLEVEFKLEQPA